MRAYIFCPIQVLDSQLEKQGPSTLAGPLPPCVGAGVPSSPVPAGLTIEQRQQPALGLQDLGLRGALLVVEIPQPVQGVHSTDRVVDEQRIVVAPQVKSVDPALLEPGLGRCGRDWGPGEGLRV